MIREGSGGGKGVAQLVPLVTAHQEEVRGPTCVRPVDHLGAGHDPGGDRLAVRWIHEVTEPLGQFGFQPTDLGRVDDAFGHRPPLVDVDALLRHLGRERLGLLPHDPLSDAGLQPKKKPPGQNAAAGTLYRTRDQSRTRQVADRRERHVAPLVQEEIDVERLLPRTEAVIGHYNDVAVGPGPLGQVPHSAVEFCEVAEGTVLNFLTLGTRVPRGSLDDVLVMQVHEPIRSLEDGEYVLDVGLFQQRPEHPTPQGLHPLDLGNHGGLAPVLLIVDLGIHRVVLSTNPFDETSDGPVGGEVAELRLGPSCRQPTGNHEAINCGWRIGHRNVEYAHPEAHLVKVGPYGRGIDHPGVGDGRCILWGVGQEAEDAVATGVHPRGHGHPRRRRVGRNR